MSHSCGHGARFAVLVSLALTPSAVDAQSPNTLLFTQMLDAQSSDTGNGVLSTIREFDIAAVTPSTTGTSAFSFFPACGMSAVIGDPDNDGIVAEYYKIKAAPLKWNHAGAFVKDKDRTTGDPRRVYWTVHDDGTTTNPKLTVFAPTATGRKPHTVLPGDFIRIGENSLAEFFITQSQVMKAAGAQTSSGVTRGASDICQDSAGNLYYSPALGGHDVSNGTTRMFVADGSIVWIPASAITYDTKGNVKDVKAASAVLLFEERKLGPGNSPGTHNLIQNSGALDRNAQKMATTLGNWPTNLTGLAIDPNGGTFTTGYTGTAKHPNLCFAWDNINYKGTIFSTAPSTGSKFLGSLATINKVKMGVTFGKATGTWLGMKQVAQTVDYPTLMGLAIIGARFAPKPPYGPSVLDIAQDGVVRVGTDPAILANFQGPSRFLPAFVMLGIGPKKGGWLISADVSSIFGGFASAYMLNGGPILTSLGLANASGQGKVSVPTPTTTGIKGVSIIAQGFFLSAGKPPTLSNPTVVEFR